VRCEDADDTTASACVLSPPAELAAAAGDVDNTVAVTWPS